MGLLCLSILLNPTIIMNNTIRRSMDRRDNLSLKDYNNMHGNMVGNIYYHICEDNRKYYRTIRIARDPYREYISPQISNPVYGNPPGV